MDGERTNVIHKEVLDSFVADLTHSFATPKESRDAASALRIRDDYDQYFQKSQAEVKQFVKDCSLRVKKAEAAVKVPYDNHHETVATTLKKHIATSLKSTTAAENKIAELKQMHEQISQDKQAAGENATQLAKVGESLPHDRHTLKLYEKLTNTIWDYSSPNIKGCILIIPFIE